MSTLPERTRPLMKRSDIVIGMWYEVHIDNHPDVRFYLEVTATHGSAYDAISGTIHNPSPKAAFIGWCEGEHTRHVYVREVISRVCQVECIDEPPGPPGPF
jgi:hypothetical protein